MELHSQQVRALAPESDPLKIGMGWTIDDLSKPQIMVESTFGDSHPGSAHLDQFVRQAVQAVNEHGGKAARYFATDLCDGIAQGHDGINYSLAHREAIVDLVEAQANASGFDGGIFIASCDKAVPAMLMSIGRLKGMSAIVVTGGVMEAHPLPEEYTVQDPACAINELLTLEQIGKFDAWEKTGVISGQQLRYYKHNACPSCGACSFMGTASTMQIMAEALGLMLPGTALMPATAPELKKAAYDAGVQLLKLLEQGIRAQDIVTKESFENAVMVHAAISGSTNATMHLPAIAHEFGIEIDADTFDRMHRGAHYLLNIRPSGDWPAQYFYYAGRRAPTSSARSKTPRAQTAALPSSRATSPPRAASSSTPPAPKRCFRSRCEQSPTTARKRASRPCCTATSAPATRSLSAMRVRAAAGCPRCSIPARPSAQTRRSLPA